MTINISNESELDRAAAELLTALGGRRHVALHGQMGAGKTTLVSAVGRVLGVADDVTSPTFSIINEYRDADDQAVYHFDFYRIANESQAADLGLDDYFDSGAFCLMEWPENVAEFLPDDTVDVDIVVKENGERELNFELSAS